MCNEYDHITETACYNKFQREKQFSRKLTELVKCNNKTTARTTVVQMPQTSMNLKTNST